jgi:L-iditol 2-dehydrogenase
MKAARLAAHRKIEFVDIPEPGPLQAGEVKIEMKYVSVCGSDIYVEYDAPLPEEDYPLVPGRPCHECAGVVVESRDPTYKAGDRVIVIPREGAGAREFVVQTADRLIRLPAWGGLDEWVLCQHSGTALYSAKHWGNPVGKNIAVLGQGGIGLSFTMIAAKQGAGKVVGIDLEQYRCDKAVELGATHSINASRDKLAEAAAELTDGQGFDVVVDASGADEGLGICVDLVKRYGQVIGFSLIRNKNTSIPHWNWVTKNVDLHGTLIAGTETPVKEIREIVELRDRGWIDPGLLKSHLWSIDRMPEAFETYMHRRDNVVKIVMEF